MLSARENAEFRPVPAHHSFLGDQTAKLYQVWSALRGEALAPQAGAFDLLNYPDLVPDLCMLDVVEGGADYRIGFLGTAFSSFFGKVETGASWSHFESRFAHSDIVASVLRDSRAILQAVTLDLLPILNGPVRLNWEGKQEVLFEGLTVPLVDDEMKATRLIGTLSWVSEGR